MSDTELLPDAPASADDEKVLHYFRCFRAFREAQGSLAAAWDALPEEQRFGLKPPPASAEVTQA